MLCLLKTRQPNRWTIERGLAPNASRESAAKCSLTITACVQRSGEHPRLSPSLAVGYIQYLRVTCSKTIHRGIRHCSDDDRIKTRLRLAALQSSDESQHSKSSTLPTAVSARKLAADFQVKDFGPDDFFCRRIFLSMTGLLGV